MSAADIEVNELAAYNRVAARIPATAQDRREGAVAPEVKLAIGE